MQPLCVIKKIASKKLVINLIIDFHGLELSLRNVNKLF
ncbi:hypothetical protein N499_1251 [Wolbachia pipientis wVitA]|nr:hypothetical protein N499_1251 [Wolbachia pipientis wVitA]